MCLMLIEIRLRGILQRAAASLRYARIFIISGDVLKGLNGYSTTVGDNPAAPPMVL